MPLSLLIRLWEDLPGPQRKGIFMSFGKLLHRMDEAGLELRVQGFINIESGKFAIGNAYYPACDCLSELFGQSQCSECPRGNSGAVGFPSGDGDGIYVVAAIIDPKEPRKTLGLLAVFDYKYQMASAVRQEIESELVPDFPIELAMQFEVSHALQIGTINVDRTLLIGDGHFAHDSNFAVLDFPNPAAGQYACIAYCQEVDTDFQATLERLQQTQGLDPLSAERALAASQAGFDAVRPALGIDESAISMPAFIPRAVVALSEQLSHLVEADEIQTEDWNLLSAQFSFGKVDTSHRSEMSVSTIWQNAMLAREWDRAAGDIDDATAKILLFDLWTWLYQGRELGDADCANYLENFKYQPTVEEQIYLLVRRGMYGAALLISKE
jgi:hypothetical protein